MIWIQFLVLFITGVYIIYKDYKERIIPNQANLFLLMSGVFMTVVDYQNLWSHILGFVLLGLFMLLVSVFTKGFGLGDVKYVFVLGLILGLKQGIDAVLIGFMIGGAVSLVLLVLKKVSKKDHIAFGPYLVMGALLSFLI